MRLIITTKILESGVTGQAFVVGILASAIGDLLKDVEYCKGSKKLIDIHVQ